MAVKIVQLQPGIIGYKLSKHRNWTADAAAAGSKLYEEWDGIYVALDPQLTLGYAADYADVTGNGEAFLFDVHLLQATPMVVCDDASIGDGSIAGNAKAQTIRQHIQKTTNVRIGDGPLMPALGMNGHIYKGLHDDEGNYEIVVPNNIASRVRLIFRNNVKIRNYVGTIV